MQKEDSTETKHRSNSGYEHTAGEKFRDSNNKGNQCRRRVTFIKRLKHHSSEYYMPSKKEIKIAVTFWIIYAIFATGGTCWNENSTLDLTKAIVDEHTFKINPYANNTLDVIYYKGGYYSDKVPGLSLMAAPVYFMYKHLAGSVEFPKDVDSGASKHYLILVFLCIFLITAPFGALTCVLVYRISRYFTDKELHKNMAVIIFGAGTFAFPASSNFLPHAPTMFFMFLAFYFIFVSRQDKKDCYLAAGLAGGAAMITEYRGVIMLGIMLLFLIFTSKPKFTIKFALGFILFFLLIQGYLHFTYGSFNAQVTNPLGVVKAIPPHIDKRIVLGNIVACRSFSHRSLKEGGIPGYGTGYSADCRRYAESFLNGDSALCAGISSYTLKADCYLRRTILAAPYNIAISMAASDKKVLAGILVRLFFYPERGLFLFLPWLILALLGLPLFFKKFKLEATVTILMVGLFLFIVASEGGLAVSQPAFYGLRLFTVLMPFLILPLLCIISKLKLRVMLFFIFLSISLNVICLQDEPALGYIGHSDGSESLPSIILSGRYFEIIHSWALFSNPLFENYLPTFLQSEPRSTLIGKITAFGMPSLASPMLAIIFVLFIWHKPVLAFLRKRNYD